MLILRRSTFVISEIDNDDPPPKPGFLSEHFAAYDDPACWGSDDPGWRVYHLQTGYRVGPKLYNFWQARAWLTVLESSGLNWHCKQYEDPGYFLLPERTRIFGWKLTADFIKNFEQNQSRAARRRLNSLSRKTWNGWRWVQI